MKRCEESDLNPCDNLFNLFFDVFKKPKKKTRKKTKTKQKKKKPHTHTVLQFSSYSFLFFGCSFIVFFVL